MNLLSKILFTLAILLVLLTPFIYSDELYNGVISAKQIWFYGAMAVLMLVTALDLLFSKQPFTIKFNSIDIALLAFYVYYLIRAATTPYMPLLHNQRFINWTLMVVMYFILKRAFKIWSLGGHSSSLGYLLLFGGHSLYKKGTNNTQQITTNDDKVNKSHRPNDASQMTTNDHRMTIFTTFINFLILTALAQAIWGLLQLYGFLPSFNSNFKITGTFFNPAPYALYLAVIFPLALDKVLFYKKLEYNTIKRQHPSNTDSFKLTHWHIATFSNPLIFKFSNYILSKLPYHISIATIIAILLVLPATMIRAAWSGALAGSLIVLQYKYHYIQQIKQLLNSCIKKIAAVAVAVAVLATLSTGVFHLKKDSANGKLFIWEVTLGKIAQKPLFGYGVGRFEAEYNNWQAEYFQKHPAEMEGPKGWVAGNTKYCFNEFLEMASETGWIGLFLFLGLLGITIMGGHKWSFGSHSSYKKTTNGVKLMTINDSKANDGSANDGRRPDAAKQMTMNDNKVNKNPTILSFIMLMCISFPFYSLPTLILFSIFLAVNSANTLPVITNVVKQGAPKLYKHALAILIIAMVSFLARYTFQQYTAYYYWDEADKLYTSGAYIEACKSFEKVTNKMKYNGNFLQYYGKAATMAQNFTKGDTLLGQAHLNTTDEVLFITLGDCYKTLKKYKQSEAAYQYAAFMVPHKLYPHYLLAKLYEQSGNHAKAIKKAKEVLSMKAKVDNMAVEEMKLEMKKIINGSL